jgi:hypothetical protein
MTRIESIIREGNLLLKQVGEGTHTVNPQFFSPAFWGSFFIDSVNKEKSGVKAELNPSKETRERVPVDCVVGIGKALQGIM